jgi:hypothetical protein
MIRKFMFKSERSPFFISVSSHRSYASYGRWFYNSMYKHRIKMSSIQYCSLNGRNMMLNRLDKNIIYCSWSGFQSGRPTGDSMLVVF